MYVYFICVLNINRFPHIAHPTSGSSHFQVSPDFPICSTNSKIGLEYIGGADNPKQIEN